MPIFMKFVPVPKTYCRVGRVCHGRLAVTRWEMDWRWGADKNWQQSLLTISGIMLRYIPVYDSNLSRRMDDV
ncbi:hypothetical protein NBRC116601_03020 [Cognatishimia sp. WU-CL00825]